MLDLLKDELEVGDDQYGGLRGVGTDHMLASMTTKILEDMDDNRGVVSVMSIDYSKAFNHMNHQKCLETMAKKGASTQGLKLAASFLSGRTMRAKIGRTLSSERGAPGGAPQGTKSGNFFFRMSIDSVQDRGVEEERMADSARENDDGPRIEETQHNSSCRTFDSDTSFNATRYDRRIKRRTAAAMTLDDTIPEGPTTSQDMHEEFLGMPPRWTKKEPWIYKYVDDITVGGKNLISHATSHISTDKERRTIHAGDLEEKFKTIREESEKIGMVVNPDKTQLLCVTEAINYEVNSFVKLGNDTINSGDRMKVLGFWLDTKMNMSAQVAAIKKKFCSKIWILRHLKRAKITERKLLRIYCAMLLPCFDYGSIVYHSMLTDLQSQELERLQSIALKTVYGWNFSYRSCLEKSGLSTLKSRRHNTCIKFAEKTAANPKFAHWFPLNDNADYDLRRQEKYKISFARHERLRNSPIYFMRRLLNEMVEMEEANPDDVDGTAQVK